MILDEYVNVKINGSNKKYLYDKGYNVDSKEIVVKVCDLSNGSNTIINVKCDICGNEKQLQYKNYNNSIKTGGYYTCSSKCAQEKIVNNNINKYGVNYPTQCEEIKEKTKQTNLERHGVEYIFQNKELKNKAKNTILEKYGVEYASQNDKIKEKSKQTNLKNYGVEYASQNDKIKEKTKKTNISRYGVNNISQYKQFRNKAKQTNINHYGVEYVLQNDDIKEKTKQTNLERYGVEYATQNINIKNKVKQTNLERYGVENQFQIDDIKKSSYILYKNKLQNKILNLINIIDISKYLIKCDKGHQFEIDRNLYYDRNRYNITICTICNPINSGQSNPELQLLECIKEYYNGEIITNTRKIIKPYELDIYLPELNLAFEYNGIYWHSEAQKSIDYHKNKVDLCKEKGISLIYIWEDDWLYKNEITKKQIRSIIVTNNININVNNIKDIVDVDIINNFILNNSLIKENIPYDYCLGYYHNTELVSVLLYNKVKNNIYIKHQLNKIKISPIIFIEYLSNLIITKFEYIIENNDLYLNELIEYGFKIEKEIKPHFLYTDKNKRLTENINGDLIKIYDCGHLKLTKNLI